MNGSPMIILIQYASQFTLMSECMLRTFLSLGEFAKSSQEVWREKFGQELLQHHSLCGQSVQVSSVNHQHITLLSVNCQHVTLLSVE